MLNILNHHMSYTNDLPLLLDRMKAKKYNKLICNLYNKEKNVVHKGTLKQALSHGLVLKKYIE